MRIIAGRLGGRQFDSPHTQKTHPMSDKMRGALFNILGDLDGLEVLDAFGGTGALGFEALSRGAAKATIIESDRPAQQTILRNIDILGLHTHAQPISATTSAWLQTNPTAIFDVVICDPPYDDVQPNLIVKLARRVKDGGLLIMSLPSSLALPSFEGLELVKQQHYGDAQLIFYRRTA
ncbi:MAG TPA: 16S rRNA (guanine(966)-N(2))-methyltransferase RsmD [Bacillota bacterium]|nr:16S rRNA (guanine(966)-N(2))-methyltransferase RsmD [Bacillota bacterium]